MRTIFLGIFIVIYFIASAQRSCLSSEYLELQKVHDPSIASRIADFEKFSKIQAQQAHKIDASVIIKIPVVVHVIYKTDAQNISDDQIRSQIDALNRDYRRLNADSVNTPDRFRQLAADIKIEFALATADPGGMATTGIVRKKTSVSYWSYDDKIKYAKQGGDDAWDASSYLNIWVGNIDGIQAYSSPIGSKPEVDGIVINPASFGTVNVPPPFNMGRTLVHEVGHWLGLKHIWGDTYCGDDLIDDTPRQGNFTSGCPTTFRTTCDNGTTGDMYMNYMDYTNDACLNLFTLGQKNRMRSMFESGGPRYSILSSKGLNEPWVKEKPASPVVESSGKNDAEIQPEIRVYPNPASGQIAMDFTSGKSWIGKQISIVNSNGTVILTASINSNDQKLNIASLRPGLYFIHGDNGTQKIKERFIKL